MSNRLTPFPLRGGGTSSLRFYAVLANGPQFLAQMALLEAKVAGVVVRLGVKAAAEVVKEEWANKARGLNDTGRGEGHYANSLRIRTRTKTKRGELGEDGSAPPRTLTGATAQVYPGNVPGVPDDEQPARYAGVLEWGGYLTEKQHRSYIPARGIARATVDSVGDKAVDAMEAHVAAALIL